MEENFFSNNFFEDIDDILNEYKENNSMPLEEIRTNIPTSTSNQENNFRKELTDNEKITAEEKIREFKFKNKIIVPDKGVELIGTLDPDNADRLIFRWHNR